MLTKKQKDGLSCLLLAIGENEQMLENLRFNIWMWEMTRDSM